MHVLYSIKYVLYSKMLYTRGAILPNLHIAWYILMLNSITICYIALNIARAIYYGI